eukprot:1161445-Pelagomonas_calceolata.AAC.12
MAGSALRLMDHANGPGQGNRLMDQINHSPGMRPMELPCAASESQSWRLLENLLGPPLSMKSSMCYTTNR